MTEKELIKKISSEIERKRRENENLIDRLEERGFADSNNTNSDLYYTTLGQVTEDLRIIHYLESLAQDLTKD